MSKQDADYLARRIVSLERRHNALAKAQQLPSSSVRLAGGGDASIADGIESGYDAWDETDYINGNLDEYGNLIDGEANNATEVPAWIGGVGDSTDLSWESSQLAIDKAKEVEVQLTTPTAVTGLQVVSNTGVWHNGIPTGEVIISWNPVTTDVNGEAISPDYVVYIDNGPNAKIDTTTQTFYLPSGIEVEIFVAAVSDKDVVGEFSEPITVTPGSPEVIALQPSAPILATDLGIVSIRWDGTYVQPDIEGGNSVQVEISLDSGTSWQIAGARFTRAGSTVIADAKTGEPVSVRFKAYDKLGRYTGVSDTVSIVVAGIQRADLDQEIRDALDEIDDYSEAIELAEGKLTLADREPTTADGANKPAGALWMQKRGGGAFTKLYEWDGTAWDERTLDTTIIPKIAIGEGTFGELSGERLKAKSAAIEKLFIGSFENLVVDPLGYSDPKYWSNASASRFQEDTGYRGAWSYTFPASTSTVHLYNSTAANIKTYGVPVIPGTTYQATVWYKTESDSDSANAVGYTSHYFTADGEQISAASVRAYGQSQEADTWYQLSYADEVPENAAYLRFTFSKRNTYSGSVTISSPVIRPMASGDLIVDGTILGRKLDVEDLWATDAWVEFLRSGAIETDYLAPYVGDTINIEGNVTIQAVLGRQDAVDELIDTVATSAEQAVSDAGIASGQALIAQTLVEDVESSLAAHQAVFRVTAQGATIEAANGAAAVEIVPTGIRLIAGGKEASRWDAGRLIVNEAVLNKATIGNHVAEKSGVRTIFRPV